MTDYPQALSQTPDLSLRHLQAELARIDLLIRRQSRLWQLAGQDPADIYRGLYVSDAEVEGMLNRSICSNWGESLELPPDEAQAFAEAEARIRSEITAVIETAQNQSASLRLLDLAAAFHLARF
ncbi:MAG TPA: hypothetical protein PKD98_31945, partial [Anaerolineae bacterium]|nr:hypothetical protein [Anaerolineae bacterium]